MHQIARRARTGVLPASIRPSRMVTIATAQAKDGLGAGPAAVLCPELLHGLASGVIAVDGRQRITACDSVAATLLRRSPHDILHRPVEVLPDSIRDALLETLRTGQAITAREIRVPEVGNLVAALRLNTTACLDEHGRPAGVVGVLNDYSPVASLLPKLRQLDRLAGMGLLSLGMAHEIRNALVAVRTYVDLLAQQDPDSKLATVVGRETRRIDAIVNRMLRSSGAVRPALAPLGMHGVLGQTLDSLDREFAERRLRLERSFGAGSDVVLGDAGQLEQALLNLLLNALDATGAGGEVRVHTALQSGDARAPFLEITITDTGIGIAPETQARLFELFFTTKPDGTGLGLAMTRHIVEEHRGTIAVESQPNRGTTFFVRLPIVDASADVGI